MDETGNGLLALRHALETLVAPALPESDPIASEQLVSAVRYLDFVLERLDLVHQRERFELGHVCSLAEAILEGVADVDPTGLAAVVDHGRAVMNDPAAGTRAVRECTAAIRAAIRADFLVGPSPSQVAGQLVLSAARDYAAFERSWYAPLGFDTEPGDPVPLSVFLDPQGAPSADAAGRA